VADGAVKNGDDARALPCQKGAPLGIVKAYLFSDSLSDVGLCRTR
jgi:hypothetical protein